MITLAYVVTRAIVGAAALGVCAIVVRLGKRAFAEIDPDREPDRDPDCDRELAPRARREDALLMRASTLMLVIAAVLAITPSVPRRAAAAPSTAQRAQDRVNAAAKVYAVRIAQYKAGTVAIDEVYQWSVRWLTALRDQPTRGKAWKQALADHATRMHDLATEAAAHAQAGTGTLADVEATTYYAAEADLWVAHGKIS